MTDSAQSGGAYLKIPVGFVGVFTGLALNIGLWIWGIARISATTEEISRNLSRVSEQVYQIDVRVRALETQQARQSAILESTKHVKP